MNYQYSLPLFPLATGQLSIAYNLIYMQKGDEW